MAGDESPGLTKAALLTVALGEEFTAQLFSKLGEEEVAALSRTMARLGVVSPEKTERVMGEFLSNFEGSGVPMLDGEQLAKMAITRSMSGEDAVKMITALDRSKEPEPFERLKNVDSRTVASFIRGEHPQTIAVILAHLPKNKAAEVITEFPEGLQYEVVLRLASLDTVTPGVVQEIDTALQEEVFNVESADSSSLGGVTSVAEILNQVDKATEDSIFGRLEDEHPELADEVRQLMFVFDDLLVIDDRGIRSILKEVKNEDLTLALKTASEELKNKILSNVSERAAAMIQEDLEVMGPVRLSDVEGAQQNVIQVARRLEKEGKIVIKGGEDVFV
ncbi:MAG: flagellar motor switch protein FliG [Proteobacteria bacterium]|nr:flagellar motor switch protein FliG [Pseudomonadota bacterium]